MRTEGSPQDEKRIRGSVWLVASGILLVAAAILMWDGRIERPDRPRVDFPRYMTNEEHQRAKVRLAPLPPLPENADDETRGHDAQSEAEEQVWRDPLLDGLGGVAPGAAVIELNAFRHGPLGRRMVDCIQGPMRDEIDEMYETAGIDLIEDLDRLAFVKDGDSVATLISGHFPEGAWETLLDEAFSTSARLGDAILYSDEDEGAIAIWRDQVLVFGENEQEVMDRLDLMEGRRSAPASPIDGSQTYGEMYGALTREMVVDLLQPMDPDLAQRAGELLTAARFNLSATNEVGMIGMLEAGSPNDASDLSRMLAGALAVARTAARRQGDHQLADLLELARVVRPGRDARQFSLELALPESYLEEIIAAWCAELEEAAAHYPSDGEGFH